MLPSYILHSPAREQCRPPEETGSLSEPQTPPHPPRPQVALLAGDTAKLLATAEAVIHLTQVD